MNDTEMFLEDLITLHNKECVRSTAFLAENQKLRKENETLKKEVLRLMGELKQEKTWAESLLNNEVLL